MKQKSTFSPLRLTLVAAAAVSFAGAADAANVHLNVSPAFVIPLSGSSVGDMRYRVSQTNWDMGIAPAGNPISGFASLNLGNNAALSPSTFAFSMTYAAGSGYSFTLNGNTVSWTTADGIKNGKNATDSYNAIQLRLQGNTGFGTVSVSNLVFGIAGATTSGTLDTVMDTSADGSPIVQWLVGNMDLSSTNWTLTGLVRGTCSGTLNCDERVKFDVYTSTAGVVPLPAAAWLLVSGLAGLGVLGRRRKTA